MSVTFVLALMLAPQALPSSADLADGKCVAAMTALSEKVTDAGEKAGADGMMMYYLGKIVGRSGQAAVTPAIEAGAALIDDSTMPQVAEGCANDVQKAMDGL